LPTVLKCTGPITRPLNAARNLSIQTLWKVAKGLKTKTSELWKAAGA